MNLAGHDLARGLAAGHHDHPRALRAAVLRIRSVRDTLCSLDLPIGRDRLRVSLGITSALVSVLGPMLMPVFSEFSRATVVGSASPETPPQQRNWLRSAAFLERAKRDLGSVVTGAATEAIDSADARLAWVRALMLTEWRLSEVAQLVDDRQVERPLFLSRH